MQKPAYALVQLSQDGRRLELSGDAPAITHAAALMHSFHGILAASVELQTGPPDRADRLAQLEAAVRDLERLSFDLVESLHEDLAETPN